MMMKTKINWKLFVYMDDEVNIILCGLRNFEEKKCVKKNARTARTLYRTHDHKFCARWIIAHTYMQR